MPPADSRVQSSIRFSDHPASSQKDMKEKKAMDEVDKVRHVNVKANTKAMWAANGHAHSFDCSRDGAVSKPGAETGRLKKRSQSAKRSAHNGLDPASPAGSETMPSCSTIKVAPPKSAPGPNPVRKTSKGRTLRHSRDGGVAGWVGGAADGRPEDRTSSPSPTRTPGVHRVSESSLGGGPRVSSGRKPRRRLTSRSDDINGGSSSDLHHQSSWSVADRSPQQQQQLHLNLNGTMSSESSEDVRLYPSQQYPASLSSSPQGGGGVGSSQGHTAGRPASSSSSPSPSSSARLWDFFEEHVRTIHDSSDLFSRHQGPSFQASSTFQETMVELFGQSEYGQPSPTTSTSPGLQSVTRNSMFVAGAANRFLRLRKRPIMGGGPPKPPDRQTVENAKHGWRVLKQYVQDNFCSKRTSQAALSWSMLRHTLKGMSDRDKTRVDLYRRYGIIPSVDDEGNLVMVNTMLSERARKAIANGSRHPLLAHTTPQQTQEDKRPLSTSSPMSSPRITSAVAAGDSNRHQRRVRSSVTRASHSDFKLAPVPRKESGGSTVGAVNGGGSSNNGNDYSSFVRSPVKNGTSTSRNSDTLGSRSSSRSHTSFVRDSFP